MSIKGRIHSVESFGTVDGPGIRMVVFLQGCPLRCLYCHNPDTWSRVGGSERYADELIAEFEKNRAFYSNGGITVTGGEPLWQIDFVTELFALAKQKGIHTCIDTSGITFNENSQKELEAMDRLMSLTDLVMLDIKHTDSAAHKVLTGANNEPVLRFCRYLEAKGVPVWIRRVVVEGYTDDPQELYSLGKFIGTLKNLKALDVLPYHGMGEQKYRDLGIDYPLAGTPALDKQKALRAKEAILRGVSEVRRKK